MDVEVIVIKALPVGQIDNFEDAVVYNTAVATREYVKGRNAYPYLTGKLRSTEIAAPILGSNKEYSLTAGVDYATSVWNYSNVNWTNPSTLPKWYATAFKDKGTVLINNAVTKALKVIK